MKRSILMFLLCCWNFVCHLFAQDHSFLFEIEHLGTKEGLLGQKVDRIYQDRNGIVWIITPEGLNRYDGRDFKWYKEFALVNYYESLLTICEDAEGLLWVFEANQEQFYPVRFLVDTYTGQSLEFDTKITNLPFRWEDIINAIQGENGTIHFLSKQDEIFTYGADGQFSHRKIDSETKPMWLIGSTGKEIIWAKTEDFKSPQSLIKIDTAGRTSHFSFSVPKPSNLTYKKTNKAGTHLFFQIYGEASHFITISNTDELEVKSFFTSGEVPDSLLLLFSDAIQTEECQTQPYFLFSAAGFKILSPNQGVVYDLANEYPKISNLIWSTNTLFNSTNLFWLNTSQGFLKIHFKKNPFLRISMNADGSINSSSCRKVIRSSNGDLIINYRQGLWIQNQNVPIDPKSPKSPIASNDIIEDKENNFWLCASSSLFKKSANGTEEIDMSKLLENQEVHNILTLYLENSGDILFGGRYIQGRYSTSDRSASVFKPDLALEKRISKRPINIYDLQKDREGNIWGCTDLGLVAIDPHQNTINSSWKEGNKTFQLPNSDIHHFYQDEEGVYWLAGKNLTRWKRQTNESKVYTTADGLPSRMLHAIYPDNYGNLWISSENGIARFNKTSHKIRNYFVSDGITHNEFNRMSHFKDKDGTIYFGGIDGVTAFHPKDLQDDNFARLKDTKLVITSFEQFSGNQDKIVDKLPQLLENNEITLQPNDPFFRIQFTLPHYIHNEQIQYEFKIMGHQEEWANIQENYIRVSGLPYGNYVLKIKGKFPTGIYANHELAIPVRVLRPFYLQLWFFILCAATIIGGFLLFYKRRVKTFKSQKANLQEIVNQRTAIIQAQKVALETSNAFKDRLFAIIAHDMRNAIYAFTDVTKTIQTFIKFNQPEKILKISDAIDTSSNHLQHLLDNLLEWALSQRGEIPYKPEPLSLSHLFAETIDSFHEIATQRSIVLKKELSQGIEIFVDKNAIITILRNLIGNALKYTPAKGSISLSAVQNGERTCIYINDTGLGMDREKLSMLFVPNLNKVHEGLDGQKGSGIGLLLVKELVDLNKGSIKVESMPGKGTSVQLIFPMP